MISHLLAFTIAGVVTGCIYAVAASGLVVTYTTSGIFNFAHGAMGMIMAFTYWDLRVNHHWPAPIALIVVLLVLAPLFGALVDRLLMRNLHGSATGTSLVVTLGLLLMLLGAAQTIWKPTVARALPEFFAGHSVRIGSINVTWHELTVIAVAALVAIFLRLLLFRTRTGVAMRAVVDDRDLSALNGARPTRITQTSWGLGTSLAALAGILLAPKLQLDQLILTFLVVNAYAAAMVGRLKSLPLTFAGALVLGLAESYAVGYLPTSGTLSHIKPTLPTFLLFAVLILLPQVRLRAGRVVGAKAPRVPGGRETGVASIVFVVAAVIVAGQLSVTDKATFGLGLVMGLIMLSLVLLTGYGGQVSLCQLSFVGFGAVIMGKIAGGGSPVGILVAAAASAALGALIALPALRLQALYLALSTLAFAVLMDALFFTNLLGGQGGNQKVGRLHLGFISFRGDFAYIVLLAIAFVLVAMLVLAIRRGPFGRLLAAMSDSPAACATLGLDLTRTKVAVFALSAGLAGVGGALYGGLKGTVGGNDFIYIQSLVVILLVTIGGITTVTGAFIGGMALALFPVLQDKLPALGSVTFLFTGLGAMSLGRNPNGIAGVLSTLGDRWRSRRRAAPRPAGLDTPLVTEEVEQVAASVG